MVWNFQILNGSYSNIVCSIYIFLIISYVSKLVSLFYLVQLCFLSLCTFHTAWVMSAQTPHTSTTLCSRQCCVSPVRVYFCMMRLLFAEKVLLYLDSNWYVLPHNFLFALHCKRGRLEVLAKKCVIYCTEIFWVPIYKLQILLGMYCYGHHK